MNTTKSEFEAGYELGRKDANAIIEELQTKLAGLSEYFNRSALINQKQVQTYMEREVELRVELIEAKSNCTKLADGIADCAAKFGIYNREVSLNGPQLLMLLEDIRTCSIKSELDTKRLDFLDSQRTWGNSFAIQKLDAGDVYVRPWKYSLVDNEFYHYVTPYSNIRTAIDVAIAEKGKPSE